VLQQTKLATKYIFQILYRCMVFNCNASRNHATKYGHCWQKHNAAKFDAKVSHSIWYECKAQ